MTRPVLYGLARSRALRSLWAMEETGIAYDHVPTHYFEESKTSAFLAVNPNGRIPALVDGELVLFESMAINLYLARTYAPQLYARTPAEQAHMEQWSVWAISEIEPLQMQIVVQKRFTPRADRDPALIERAAAALERPLAVLDRHLADRPYLLGARFTIADLNVAGVMHLLRAVDFDYAEHAHVSDWAGRCYARPALAAAQARE